MKLECGLNLVTCCQRIEYGKEKNSNFTEILATLSEPMIQINITGNNSCWDRVPSDTMWWEGHLTYEVFFPKIHNPDLIMRKHHINANGGTFCKMPDQYSAKLSGLGKKANDWETVLEQKRQRRHDWMPGGNLLGILGQVNDLSWGFDPWSEN